MTTQPDVAGAVLALDRAMIALAVAKSTLLGETLDLAAAEASPANPYGSAKHGQFGAPSEARCGSCGHKILKRGDGHGWVHETGLFAAICDEESPQPAPTGHLPQHTHGEPGCTYTGCTLHDAAVTR